MTRTQLINLLLDKKFFVWLDEVRQDLAKVLCILFKQSKWYYRCLRNAPFIYIGSYNDFIDYDYNPGTFCHKYCNKEESASKVIKIAEHIHIPFKNQEEVAKALDEYGCWIYFKNRPSEEPQKHYMIVGYDNSSVTICDQLKVKTIPFYELVEYYYFRSNDENCGISVNLLEEELK